MIQTLCLRIPSAPYSKLATIVVEELRSYIQHANSNGNIESALGDNNASRLHGLFLQRPIRLDRLFVLCPGRCENLVRQEKGERFALKAMSEVH